MLIQILFLFKLRGIQQMIVFLPEIVANDVCMLLDNLRLLSCSAVWKCYWNFATDEQSPFLEHVRFVVIVDAELRKKDFILVS